MAAQMTEEEFIKSLFTLAAIQVGRDVDVDRTWDGGYHITVVPLIDEGGRIAADLTAKQAFALVAKSNNSTESAYARGYIQYLAQSITQELDNAD